MKIDLHIVLDLDVPAFEWLTDEEHPEYVAARNCDREAVKTLLRVAGGSHPLDSLNAVHVISVVPAD